MSGRKIFWAVIDQGAMAVSFFFVTFLLARELTQEAYGAFATAYSILVLGQLLYQGMFYEPISIYGVDRFSGKFWRYAVGVLKAHFIIASGLALACVITAAVVSNASVKYALYGLAFSLPCILFYGVVRRFLYANYLTVQPALTSLLYSAATIGCIYLLMHLSRLSLLLVFVALGMVSLLTGIVGLVVVYFQTGVDSQGEVPILEVVSDHYNYGKFAASSYSVNWLSGNVYFVALPLILGLEATGALKALLNFIAPVQQIVSALSLIYLPYFAGILKSQGSGVLVKKVYFYLLLIILLQVGNLLFFYLLGEEVLLLVYGGKYTELSGYVIWIGLIPLLGGIASPFLCALRALNLPGKILNANLFAALVVPFALLLAYFFKIDGALLGLVLSSSISTFLVYYYFLTLSGNEMSRGR